MNDSNKKIKYLFLLIGDIGILYLSLWLTLGIRYGFRPKTEFWQLHLIPFSIIYFLWLIVFFINNFYEISFAKNNLKFYSALTRAILINAGIALAFFYLVPSLGITPRTNLFINLLIFSLLFAIWRNLFNALSKISGLKNIAIIGINKQSLEIAQEISQNPQLGYRIKAFIRCNNESRSQLFKRYFSEKELKNLKIYPNAKNLQFLLLDNQISTAVVSPEAYQFPELISDLYDCLKNRIDFINLATFSERLIQKIPLGAINQVWFLENITENGKSSYELFKKIFDFFSAIILSLISLPFWPVIALTIKLESEGPVFYRQERVGKGGKSFTIIKFRSMVKDAEKMGAQWTHDNDPRITKMGNFLRRTRLDELPQIINILKGDISLVGPRAERPEFHEKLKQAVPFFEERYLIKPGLTGWAQIQYRYGSSIDDTIEKLKYDLYYIKNRSFLLDLNIILKTVNIVIRGGGK